MSKIDHVELNIFNGPVDVAPSKYELRIYFGENTFSLWLRDGMSITETLAQILDLAKHIVTGREP